MVEYRKKKHVKVVVMFRGIINVCGLLNNPYNLYEPYEHKK